ncbi:MAG: endonuclease NucS [Desulfobacter postgatei]|uniref:endonuclease NucS domain-containing protein n=1 Tax=Desulfobacter postgatei TaxID=2293 RepID=UPI0023F30251|nr:endonuclease NucS domain-containing protein [Desulfobacter postgatei]MDD4274085.1 endonuclease NucS [Desulfobacter postgatei]
MGKDLKEYERLAAEIFFTPERDISPLLEIGMNINSAKDTMRCYEKLINGKPFSRSMQQNVIIALFEKLFKDQNFEVIPNVIKALEENFEIRLVKYNDNKIGARRVVNEYKNKWLLLSDENDLITLNEINKEIGGPIREVDKQHLAQRIRTKLLEKDMEDLIIENPHKYLDEPDLKLISRQYSIGNYRFDLLFEDRHGAKLIVEIQRGTLDRNHTYKIFDYFDEFKTKHPLEFIELMIVANKINRERRNRLKSHGVSFKEIPESIFLEDLAAKIPVPPSVPIIETTTFSNSHSDKERFERLLSLKSWHEECSGKNELTSHRILQFKAVLEKYDWEIPYSHFNNETINDPSLRNSQIFPVICAYHAGYLVIGEQFLLLKEDKKNEITGSCDSDNKGDIKHPFLNLIRQQQRHAQYIKHLDTIEKIDFVEKIHLLLCDQENIVRTFNKKEISYSNGTKFGCVVPQKHKIVVGPLLVRFEEINDPQQKCRDIRGKTYASGGEARADF